MLDKDGKGKLRLTPRAVSKMQRKALMEVFANLRTGQREGHEKVTPGLGGERIEGTKPYQYGDPVSELDLHQTLHNALTRAWPARRSCIRTARVASIKFTSTNTISSSISTKASPVAPPSSCWT